MIDITKPKFDPIPLPGSPGFGSAGPRIGEPVPPPKVTSGPVLANKPDAPTTPAAPPAPTWVKEALGKLFVPTRTKAAVLAAVVALGGGMYAAKLFTGSPEPTATAVLDVNHPEQTSPTPAPVVATEPNTLVSLTPMPTATTPVPAPNLTFENVPIVTTPTAADQFRGRDVSAPPVPKVELTSSAVQVPDLTFPVPSATMPVASATVPQPVGVAAVPSIDIPSPTGSIAGTIRTVDNTSPTVSGPGGGNMVVPAIPGGETTTTVPMPTFPATTGGTVSGSGGIDVPSLGGVGGGAAAPVTPPSATVPSLVSQPPAPPAVVSPSTTTTATSSTPPAVPSLTGIGAGSIGAGSVTPSPVPTPAPVGFDSSRTSTSLPPVVTTATSSREPETSFDVDVHPVRAGDSYSAISKSYYGDAAFADALRAYDESRAGRTSGTVHVPPVWVLRKRYPQAIRGESAVPPAATVPAERTVPVSATGGADWNSSRPTGRVKTFVTPRAMTMREISKDAFGDELYWNRVWDLNLNLSTDAVLPQGTKVNLPTDAKVGQ